MIIAARARCNDKVRPMANYFVDGGKPACQHGAIMLLRDYLKQSKTKQTELARDLGVRTSTIQRWLKRERIPKAEMVAKIEDATDGKVRLRDFVGRPAE